MGELKQKILHYAKKTILSCYVPSVTVMKAWVTKRSLYSRLFYIGLFYGFAMEHVVFLIGNSYNELRENMVALCRGGSAEGENDL